MRIAIITDAWPPQINGVVTTLSHTIKTLRSLGHEVLAITPEFFKTIPCPTYPEIPISLRPRQKLEQLLREFDPNAVHIATEGPLGWTARSYCLRNSLRFTTSYHTRFPEYIRLRIPLPLWFSYAVVRRFHAAAQRTMVATLDLQSELQKRGFTNLCLWSRGVDTELFRPHPKSFLQDARPIALYVGRVAVEKNIDDLCMIDG